jgi:Holliday junction resolvasome RuvABC ATP-dependent DNA helicase subunit
MNNVEYDFSEVVFLLATTDAGKLTEAFVSRPERTYIRPYTLPEIAAIVWLHAKTLLGDAELTQGACLEIAARKAGNPRPAVNVVNPIVSSVFKSLQAEKGSSVPTREAVAARMTAEEVSQWFERQNVDFNGIDELGKEYLKLLNRRGTISAAEVKRALGISNESDFEQYSEYLSRLGLVSVSNTGRSLTREGKRYLTAVPIMNLRDRIARKTS